MVAIDPIDAQLLDALTRNPRATTSALSQAIGAARNTVQARLNRFVERGVLRSFAHRIDPAALGYPLTAFITITVRQQQLDSVADALAQIPEVLEVYGLSGPVDLWARVVARDADDLYRIAGHVLATPGVARTETALLMRRLVDFRVDELLAREMDSRPVRR